MGTAGLRAQLLEGMPARSLGIAAAMLAEWERAVEAVPELAPVAAAELMALLRLQPREREAELRRRWGRAGDAAVELVGRDAGRAERTRASG